MANLANRRSVMTLFSSPTDSMCHRTRLVLAEKDITYDLIEVDLKSPPEDLSDLNPYCTTPTLVDRELVLYDSRVIIEYLDERFPHPPLMPIDPIGRAKTRLALFRVEHDWYPLVYEIVHKGSKNGVKARKMLRERIIASADVFGAMPFFLSEELSLVDCSIAAILWRLPSLGIELPAEAKSVKAYAERIFARPAFKASLSEKEKLMRVYEGF